MEYFIDENVVKSAIQAFSFNLRVNNYAAERVAFGYEKPGDKAPVDLYLKHLKMDAVNEAFRRRYTHGIYIDKQEYITRDQDYDEFVRDIFVDQMEYIFIDAPTDKRMILAEEEIPLKSRYRNYVLGLLPLFTEIMKLKIDYTAFDIVPIDAALRKTEYHKWKRFVTSILIKPLKTGRRIDRYVKDFAAAPYYIDRLIEKRGKRFYLKTANAGSRDYILALFSVMQFMNAENNGLFELKMREWERLRA